MQINKKIGPHTFEMRTSSMGSINPWFMDILIRYHIAAFGTSDVKNYVRYDGKIYGVYGFDYEIDERLSMWESLYEEDKEGVEKDIQDWIERNCNTEFEGGTLDDILKIWDIEIVKHLEWMRENNSIFHINEKTFENMSLLFGEMVNKRCYLPTDELDVDGSENYIVMDIPINKEIIKVRLEIFENGFKYTFINADGSVYYSTIKDMNKNNISEFTNIIRKPRKI